MAQLIVRNVDAEIVRRLGACRATRALRRGGAPRDSAASPAERGLRPDPRRSHPCDAERRVGCRLCAPEGEAPQNPPVTSFLVDTNVLSEARKANRTNPRVVASIETTSRGTLPQRTRHGRDPAWH